MKMVYAFLVKIKKERNFACRSSLPVQNEGAYSFDPYPTPNWLDSTFNSQGDHETLTLAILFSMYYE
jgi:hypothetical protein